LIFSSTAKRKNGEGKKERREIWRGNPSLGALEKKGGGNAKCADGSKYGRHGGGGKKKGGSNLGPLSERGEQDKQIFSDRRAP